MRRFMVLLSVLGLAGAASISGAGGSAALGALRPVEVTITKTVVGTDPGVAFPIVLTCSSEGSDDPDVPQIPNDGEITQTVNLKGGESTTVEVQLPALGSVIATCSVSEDPAAAALPDGYVCTAVVAPESIVVYEAAAPSTTIPRDDFEFAVTNTCTVVAPAAVIAPPSFTG